MAENKKITELTSATPSGGFAFVVATGDDNYRVSYKDLSEQSSIGAKTGSFLDALTISGTQVLTGVVDDPAFQDLQDQVDQGGGGGGGGGIDTSTFVFFSDADNENGSIFKTYHSTPTSDTHLSGITVDNSDDIRLNIRWDGPSNDYMGTGYIDGQQIPLENIVELGDKTRRFEGYLDNLNLQGKTSVLAEANGATAELSFSSLGSGPQPSSVTIDNITNATPAQGQELGTDSLKSGDIINVFVDFDFSQYPDQLQRPTEIKVFAYELAEEIEYDTYNFVNTNGDIHRATIPVTVSNYSGDLNVRVVAKNGIGTIGTITTSSNTVNVDQVYPAISISAPSSYSGRTDGLREGENAVFSNTISNFDPNSGDTVSYTVIGSEISINEPATYTVQKTVQYVQGIFSNSSNVNVEALKVSNGSKSSAQTTVRVANGPVINTLSIDNNSVSAQSPNIVGTSAIKGGDTINLVAQIDTNGVSQNNISIQVYNEGISNLVNFSNFSSTSIGGDVYRYTIPVTVTSSRNGSLTAKIICRNNYGTLSDDLTSSNNYEVDNVYPSASITSTSYPAINASTKNYTLTANGSSDYIFDGDVIGNDPTLNVNVGDTLVFQNDTGSHPLAIKDSSNLDVATQSGTSLNWIPTSAGTYTYYCVTHPGSMFGTITVSSVQSFQQAIKSSESAVVTNTASGFDQIEYSSQSNELNISNSTNFEGQKTVTYNSGNYNISSNNFQVKATKTSNGAVIIANSNVKIANSPIVLSIQNLASTLDSSASGMTDDFTLNGTQNFLSIPSLSTDPSQNPASSLSIISSGTNQSSNTFRITVKDVDQKGQFAWQASSFNLANIPTTVITNNANYNLAGFQPRDIIADPNSLAQGLAPIGTTVSNTSNLVFENVSKGGSGPNGGTMFTYKSYADGIQLGPNYNEIDQFTVCDSNGITDSQGDYVFNLDQDNRLANTSTANPAKFIIQETI